MTTDEPETPKIREPLAELERKLLEAYLAGAGHSLDALLTRTDAEARALLTAASRYASDKLAEVEARSRYLHALHGSP
ncbi:MAG: hypothetical protein A3F70_11050 [Acidobacteria bacterium RIFCSPLOWO2_12_FULL_67_14]|nr:MAG: hypothetical protein A3H29_16870 [Acidobacteria bacterium RIFCSPLOWO2_02_FULL_67_21]OFW39082.1 MAG: hypothetical protein A3F70_11050 [Acidobacteria bacterium RIFCSPLOWO2_12_FULL_67_14]